MGVPATTLIPAPDSRALGMVIANTVSTQYATSPPALFISERGQRPGTGKESTKNKASFLKTAQGFAAEMSGNAPGPQEKKKKRVHGP